MTLPCQTPFALGRTWCRSLALAAASLCLWAAPAAQAGVSCRPATPLEAATWISPVAKPGVISPHDGTCFATGYTVVGTDGVRMTANVFLPRGAHEPGRKFPGVVFISSWAAADFFEYLGQQQRLAQDGYVAMAYTARGFYLSEGTVGVAGPQDVSDVSSAINWMLTNTPADVNNIGASGISYGAGLSLLAAAADTRIKAVTALSGWGTLMDQLYGQDTPNPTWANILFLSGAVTGRLDPIVAEYSAAIQNPDTPKSKIDEIRAWGAERSPSTFVAALNQRKVPIFISKNMQDDMFQSASSLSLFSQLIGPKKFLLNPGIHAMTELPGATLGLDNYPMDQAHRWMNRFLKGEQNGIDQGAKLDWQVKFSTRRETLSNWPAPELKNTTYHLSPRGAFYWDIWCFCFRGHNGGISTAKNTKAGSDAMSNLLDTTATTGLIPILSTTGESLGLPVLNYMPSVAWNHGIRYEGPALSKTLQIRGIPQIKLRVTPSQSRGMVVAYLYDVDALGFATLITHGARSVHWATPRKTIDFPIDLATTAYDLPAGHHIGIVVDTADSLYGAPVRFGEAFSMNLEFSSATSSTLILPTR